MSTRPLVVAVVGSRFGWVAQLAEQRTENPRVGGSIPPPATPHFHREKCAIFSSEIAKVHLEITTGCDRYEAFVRLCRKRESVLPSAPITQRKLARFFL